MDNNQTTNLVTVLTNQTRVVSRNLVITITKLQQRRPSNLKIAKKLKSMSSNRVFRSKETKRVKEVMLLKRQWD
jgi:hypothetical protein